MLDDQFMKREEIDMKKELVRKNYMKMEDDCHYQTVHFGRRDGVTGVVGVSSDIWERCLICSSYLEGSSILSS